VGPWAKALDQGSAAAKRSRLIKLLDTGWWHISDRSDFRNVDNLFIG
jgi:hypothetical protein